MMKDGDRQSIARTSGSSLPSGHSRGDEGSATIELPLDGVLDLHTFAPEEVSALLPEYLAACREKGLFAIRVVHGKGTGTLRRTVEAVLARSGLVESYHLADASAGGWGATWVRLRRV